MRINNKLLVGLLSLAMLCGISFTTANSNASAKHIPHVRTTYIQHPAHNNSNNIVNIRYRNHAHYMNTKSFPPTMGDKAALIKQSQIQSRPANIRTANNILRHRHYSTIRKAHTSWFTDGLSPVNLKARSWVSWHESRHEWYVLSYGHRCIGYFQLDPAYLGYKNGHINLNKKHQVKVADAYAKSRYGDWVNAKQFWHAHHWY